ncbi:hypothetical protein [Mesorhizobium sp. CN2-181]|uniref:hypothetical protein n=1 Tax=Mesorhizobium yinganensis TaxID=3157707 RepID=UPI0032B8215A
MIKSDFLGPIIARKIHAVPTPQSGYRKLLPLPVWVAFNPGMKAAELRKRVGAILAAEERQPTDWMEVERTSDRLRRLLEAEPKTRCPEIVERFLADGHVRAISKPYAAVQREGIRRFVDRGERVDSVRILLWSTWIAMAFVVGVLLWAVI